jgi:hypothetical protein
MVTTGFTEILDQELVLTNPIDPILHTFRKNLELLSTPLAE